MTVTVYTRPNCQPCKGTKRLLDKGGVEYEEVDISTDLQAREAVAALGYMQAPVVVVRKPGATEDIHWSGLNPFKITEHITNAVKEKN